MGHTLGTKNRCSRASMLGAIVALSLAGAAACTTTDSATAPKSASAPDEPTSLTLMIRGRELTVLGSATPTAEDLPIELPAGDDEDMLRWSLEGATGNHTGRTPDPRRVEFEGVIEGAEGASSSVLREGGVVTVTVPSAHGKLSLTSPDGSEWSVDLDGVRGAGVRPLGIHVLGTDAGGSAAATTSDAAGNAERPITIQGGDPCTGVVGVLFMPEGYTARNMAEFQRAVRSIVADFLALPDMAGFQNNFAFYMQFVDSAEDGVGVGRSRNTAFRYARDSQHRMSKLYTQGWPEATARAFMDARNAVHSQVLVIVPNTDSGQSSSVHATREVTLVPSSLAGKRLLHELGHALPGLADEYVEHARCRRQEAGGKPNTSKDWENPKWKSFFGGRPARGAEYCRDIFSPTDQCMMRSIEFGLCPVCKRAFETFFAGRTEAARRTRAECQNSRAGSEAGTSGLPCNLFAEGYCGNGSTCSWTGEDYCCKPGARSGTGRACTRDSDCPSGNICSRNNNNSNSNNNNGGGGFACEPRGRAACQ